MTKIEWHYQKAYMCQFFDHWSFVSLQSEGRISEQDKKQLIKDCDFLDKMVNLFKLIEHDENIIRFLKLKYQLLLFLEDEESANKIKDEIGNLIEINDF